MEKILLSRQCVHFLKCFETLSFSLAARDLRVSQSALSLSIKQFEEQIGFRLFERGRGLGKLRPTEEAAGLYGKIDQVRNTLNVSPLQKGEPKLWRIACIPSYARNHLLPHLRKTQLLSRAQVFIVRTAKALAALQKQEIDVAFVLAKTPPLRDRKRCVELQEEKVAVVGQKREYGSIVDKKSMNELNHYPWIVGDRVYENLSASLPDHTPGFYVEDHFSARFLALEGYGLAQLQLDYFSKQELSQLAISKMRIHHTGIRVYAVIRSGLADTARAELVKLVTGLKLP